MLSKVDSAGRVTLILETGFPHIKGPRANRSGKVTIKVNSRRRSLKLHFDYSNQYLDLCVQGQRCHESKGNENGKKARILIRLAKQQLFGTFLCRCCTTATRQDRMSSISLGRDKQTTKNSTCSLLT